MEQTDSALLSEIVHHRDAEAFASLYRRHEAELFSLAMRITRNRERAEEALQEAMLRVWRAAGSFEGSESGVRAWLLQIVARASLSALRTGKRQETKKSRALARAEVGLEARAEPQPASTLEKKQLLADLRRLLDKLPELDRQVATLYFGGALSQREISNALAVPRRTIAYKIDETLKTLRTSLTQAGYSAALPLLAAETLSQALCSGFTAPPDLGVRLLERITASGFSPGRAAAAPEPAATAPPARLTVPAAVAAGALLSGAAYLVLAHSQQAAPPSPAPRSVQAPGPGEGPLHATWDFSRGPAEDLKVLQGGWSWAATGKDGNMEADPDQGVWVKLPLTFPKRPAVIRINLHAESGMPVRAKTQSYAYWVQGGGMVPHWLWENETPFSTPNSRIDFRYALYCLDQGIITQRDGRTVRVQRFSQSYPAPHMILYFRFFHITSIAVSSLDFGEIPPPVRSLETQIRQLGGVGIFVNEHGSRTPAGSGP